MTTVSAPTDRWRLGEEASELLKLIGFEPTGEEQARILRCRKRFKAVSGGEQSGKSIEASADFILHFAEDLATFPGENLLYWLVAADYDRTKAEFGYIAENLSRLGLDVDASKVVNPGSIDVRYKPRSKDERIEDRKPFLRIETKSGKDPRTLSMFAPNGIIGCEASQLDLETYFKCLARVAPKKGWMHLAGTFEGALGWYPSLVNGWKNGDKDTQSFSLPATSNFHFYPGGMENEEIKRLKRESSDDFFLERIMGIASPPKDMVFGKEFRPDIHIRDLEYDPYLPVYISDDPGYGHAHAIEVWQIASGGQIRVFDEIYERGIITEDLIDICIKREWWKNENKTLVIDPNYASQHAATHSVAEIWQERAGLANSVSKKVSINEGTERLKRFLKVDAVSGEPGIVFNGKLRPDRNGEMKPTCVGVLSELGAYPNPFDNQTHVYSMKKDREGNIIGDTPDDRFNDGCKALIYGIVEHFGLVVSDANTEFVTQAYARLGNSENYNTAEIRRRLAKNRQDGYFGLAREITR